MKNRKPVKPVTLEMPFDEALGRNDQTVHEPNVATADDLIIYATEKGLRVETRMVGETLWMTNLQVAALFGRDRTTILRHVTNIVSEGELPEENNVQKMHFIPGAGRPAMILSLDMIISVGYRVSSKEATRFRIWATSVLKQFIIKGFALDDERLKDPQRNDHFAELRQRIAAIRASEAVVYAELKRIFAMCGDYDPKSLKSRNFFATIQNKLHHAVTSQTAAEIIASRADATQPNMGLTAWKGDEITLADVRIAKNHLGQLEIDDLNRATTMLLDYFEDQTERRRLVSMEEAEEKLDEWLRFNERPILRGRGQVKMEIAKTHAEGEFRKWDAQRLEQAKAEADASLALALHEQVKALPKIKWKK